MKKNESRSFSIGRNLEIAKAYKAELEKEEAKKVCEEQPKSNIGEVSAFVETQRKIREKNIRFREFSENMYREAHQYGENNRTKTVPRGSYADRQQTIESTGYSGEDMDTSSANSRMSARNKR